MENKYFSLSPVDNNKLVRIIQVAFGSICIAIAIFWLIFNLRSLKADSTLWITILFLAGFGFYMIWSGLGKASRFVEIKSTNIRIKKTILLPAIEMQATEIRKIDLFPFKIVFSLKTSRETILRLSSSFYETNAKIVDAVLIFAEENSIEIEEIEEKI